MGDARSSFVRGKRGGLHDYIVSHSVRATEHPEVQKLQQKSLEHPRGGMVSPEDSVAVLQMLLKLLGARKVIEVGVFTGFTTLGMALGLPDDGCIIACDISTEFTDVGQPHWKAAGVDSKIDLRIAPAAETLADLVKDGQAGSFDLAFIDADKGGYDEYFELSLALLRPGGVIAVDNVLWHGKVTDPTANDADTVAIKAFNDKIYADERVDIAMLTNSDGITIARKR